MTISEESETDGLAAADEMGCQTIPRGSALGRYIIIELLGAGGMGAVYRAYDPELNRGVALKLLSLRKKGTSSVERAKIRLMREAQALAKLSHPNVVAVHDVGSFGGDVFIAMELVEGKTLKDWMTESKKPVREIVEVMSAAGRGLAAAHKVGLIHRDFKPRNVIVGHDGRVRVLDFGLARAVDQDEDAEQKPVENSDIISSDRNLLLTPITQGDGILGSPRYMAPEQHLGSKTDARTDQFSFCVVLFEALYGVRPFAGRTLRELRNNILQNRVQAPENTDGVPAWLHKIILRGLEPNPDDRFPSMEALLDDLQTDPDEVARRRRASRNRKLLLISFILLTTVLPFPIWYGLRYRTYQLCDATESEFIGVWDGPTKASVHKAFLDTQVPYAPGTWSRLETNVDEYLADWKKMRSEVCEARLWSATLSEELFDLRMTCLRKQLRILKALMKVFVKADAKVLEKAIQASKALENVALCADETALRSPYPPPSSPEMKARVADLRERLAEAEAFEKTGKYREGFELVQKLKSEFALVDYPPVRAEVLALEGDFLERIGEYQSAEKILLEATRVAGESRNVLMAAKAMTNLAFVVGYDQARHGDGLLLGRAAEVILNLGGGDRTVQSYLFNCIGAVFWRQANYDKAIEYYRKALEADEKTLGLEHPEVARSLNNIGVVFEVQSEYEKALECYRRALHINEKALGADHPVVAYTLNNMGLIYLRQGDYNTAARYLRKSMAIDERVLGPEHPELAYVLNSLGQVYWKTGEFDKALQHYKNALTVWEKAQGSNHPIVAESLFGIGRMQVDLHSPEKAIEPLERALRLCEKITCQPEPFGQGLFALARALALTGGDKKRVIRLANLARVEFGKAAYLKKDLETVDAWLEKAR